MAQIDANSTRGLETLYPITKLYQVLMRVDLIFFEIIGMKLKSVIPAKIQKRISGTNRYLAFPAKKTA